MINIDLELIKKQELFAKFDQKELDFIISRSSLLNLPKDELLFSTGDTALRFYILTDGEIRILKTSDEGEKKEIANFEDGTTIGDFDFARGAVYDACAEAAQDSKLIVFPGLNSTLDSLLNEAPDIVCKILLNAIVMMTGRIKAGNRLILDKLSWAQDIHRRAYEDAGTGLWKQALINDVIKGSLKEPAALIMLKPDRFKILVDSNGHSAGDEAMIRIALILKNTCRQFPEAWPLRFKSNEVGIIINNCDAAKADEIARHLAEEINEMEPVQLDKDKSEFKFTATISWSIWHGDKTTWDNLFEGNYANLLDTWKASGNIIVHYSNQEKI